MSLLFKLKLDVGILLRLLQQLVSELQVASGGLSVVVGFLLRIFVDNKRRAVQTDLGPLL